MKKLLTLFLIFCMTFCMAACGSADENSGSASENTAVTDQNASAGADENGTAAEQTEETAETAELLTENQVLQAVKNYCFEVNPDLDTLAEQEEYDVDWEVSTNENNEIVVLFRSYTGSETRYYVDPASGDVHTTELVPGIMDEEQPSEETFNVKDYM